MRTIYYLNTKHPTYEQRNDLYDVGVRWDSRRRRWWSTKKVAARRALSLIPDSTARLEVAKVPELPASGDYRGGRPRKPRKAMTNGHGTTSAGAGASPHPVPVGQPFVRTGSGDRRHVADRRGPNRPEAVMCVPMQ